MESVVNGLHHRAQMLHDQIALALMAQREQKVDMSGVIATYRSLLAEMYSDGLPLAQLQDTSDLILHAEGPSARHHAAGTGAVAWLCQEAEKRIKQLGLAALKVSGAHAKDVERDLQVLLNGLAPGSLYLGFSIDSVKSRNSQAVGHGYLHEDDSELDTIRSVVNMLPTVPQFVGSDKVNSVFAEQVPDPSVRDATLIAAFHLSPTGRRGIHSIDISAPKAQNKEAGKFTVKERVVLRESAVKAPLMRHSKSGSFIGQLREIDLDAHRFHLRDIPNVGSVRCVFHASNEADARNALGKGVKVTGEFESDADGRPRLMRVQRIERFQAQSRIDGDNDD